MKNSLKSKIRLATIALAIFVCAFGIGSWLVVSLFTENTFYVVLFRFFVSAAAIITYGWWLANEVVRPIEKVSLLAKSLERGAATTLPKTSGSAETDEMLQSLHRNNQQLQNLVGLMDKVSGGNLNVTLEPLQQSDRLSNSFQKLLAKVTESINAKRDLDKLKAAIRQISEEITRVKDGNFDVEIKADFKHTKEITDTLQFLINRLNELIHQVKDDSKQTQNTAREMQKTLLGLADAGEARVREMNGSRVALKQIPQTVRGISGELYASSQTARQSIERARIGSQAARENVQAAGALRQHIRESVKRVNRLGERTQEIGKVAKTIEDLAQRTNMIALNASIQIADAGEKGRGFVQLAEEIERLATRAADTNKQISTLNKTVTAEIGELERSLSDGVGEAANLSKFAIETGNSLSEIEKYIEQFLSLQEKLATFSGEQSADAEIAFESFVGSVEGTQRAVKVIRESETQAAQMAAAMENLQIAVASYKTPQPPQPPQTTTKEFAAAKESATDFEPEFYT